MTTHITLLAGLLATALLGGCASHQPSSAITKVQMFHLKTDIPPITQDQMIRSESQKRLWGALTWNERQDRLGNYYLVHWRSADKTPATVRFEYRQALSGNKLLKKEVPFDNPGHNNTAEFNVLGKDYKTNGRVVAWRVQVIQGGQVIGEETSFLWN